MEHLFEDWKQLLLMTQKLRNSYWTVQHWLHINGGLEDVRFNTDCFSFLLSFFFSGTFGKPRHSGCTALQSRQVPWDSPFHRSIKGWRNPYAVGRNYNRRNRLQVGNERHQQWLLRIQECADSKDANADEEQPNFTCKNEFIQRKTHWENNESKLRKYFLYFKDGTYIKSPSSKLTYGTMIFVRVVLVADAASYLKKAVTIATRYSAVRHQSQIKPEWVEHSTCSNTYLKVLE